MAKKLLNIYHLKLHLFWEENANKDNQINCIEIQCNSGRKGERFYGLDSNNVDSFAVLKEAENRFSPYQMAGANLCLQKSLKSALIHVNDGYEPDERNYPWK